MNVVLAYRDEAGRAATRRLLVLHGFEVETASGGVECLDKLRKLSDPVLVLDYELPWGGGDGVLAVLHEGTTLVGTPVILITARRLRPRRAGLVTASQLLGVLEKPVAPEALLKAIRDVRTGTGSGGFWRGAEG